MSVAYTLLGLLAFVALTLGTAVFVAAEFSLTALERSTVDANARTGGRRDRWSSAPTARCRSSCPAPARHLHHHPGHRLPRRAADRVAHPARCSTALGLPAASPAASPLAWRC